MRRGRDYPGGPVDETLPAIPDPVIAQYELSQGLQHWLAVRKDQR